MSVSNSKLACYRECPKKYEFRYERNEPEEKSPEMERGIHGHAILEAYYNPINTELRCTMGQTWLDQLVHSEVGDNSETTATFLEIFRDYHAWATTIAIPPDTEFSDFRVEERIAKVIVETDAFTFEGRLDIRATHPTWGTVVWDHKFKSQWGENIAYQLDFEEQNKQYAYLANVNMVFYNLIRTVPAKTRPKFERIGIFVSGAEALRSVEDANGTRRQILWSQMTGLYPRNRGWNCQRCPFVAPCFM